MSSNSDIVNRFCAAFERMDADELIAYFHDDATYHNIPMTALKGRDAIHGNFVKLREKFSAISFDTITQVCVGNIVFNERIDYMTVGERRIILPVAGVFELNDGLIRAWRDYFDLTPLKATAS